MTSSTLLSLAWHAWNGYRIYSDPEMGTFVCSLVSSLLLVSCALTGGFLPLIVWEAAIACVEVVGTVLLLQAAARKLEEDGMTLGDEEITHLRSILAAVIIAHGARFALCIALSSLISGA